MRLAVERPTFSLELEKAYFDTLGEACLPKCHDDNYDCLTRRYILKFVSKPVSTAANLHLRTVAAAVHTVIPVIPN